MNCGQVGCPEGSDVQVTFTLNGAAPKRPAIQVLWQVLVCGKHAGEIVTETIPDMLAVPGSVMIQPVPMPDVSSETESSPSRPSRASAVLADRA